MKKSKAVEASAGLEADGVYATIEEAQKAAEDEAKEAGVDPSAVMHSSPDGYATGAGDMVHPGNPGADHLAKTKAVHPDKDK